MRLACYYAAMPIVLSREDGLFSLLLNQQQWISPAEFAPLFVSSLSLPRADAMRACRLQRGILFQGLTRDAADALSENMAELNVKTSVVADSDMPQLPRPIDVALANIELEGLRTPSIKGAGLPELWQFSNLRSISAAIIIDPVQQAAGLVDSIDSELMAEAEDRALLAQGQVEKARNRVFPLSEELQRGDVNVAQALRAVLTKDVEPADPEHGFGRIQIVLDLFFQDPLDRLRITGKTRIQNHIRTASIVNNLHAALKDITENAPSVTLSESSVSLLKGEDSSDYLFEDLRQFEEYQRWTFYWQLQAK